MSLSFLFEKHAILHFNNWTSILTSKSVNAENLEFFLFFKFFSRFQINYLAADLLNNKNSESTLKKVINIFDVINLKILHNIIRYLITTNILIKIIMQMSYYFNNVYIFDSENDIFISNFEDLHRFYWLLQIWSQLNEKVQKNKNKTSKLQNNSAQLIHYLDKSINENHQVDDNDFLFKFDDLFIYEVLLVFTLNDKDALSELNIVKLLDNALKLKNEKNFIDFQQIVNSLSSLTDMKKTALYYYIKNNLNIWYDKWKNISTDEYSETDIDVEIQNIIQQVHDLVKQAEKYNLMNSNKIRKNHSKIKNVFNHINMKIHTIE